MSKLTDQQLDDIFRGHLLDLEKELPADSWSVLSKEVARNNFLKFSWKSFNIFYVAGIAAVSISTVVYFAVSKPSISNVVPPAEKNIPLLQDTITSQEQPIVSKVEESQIQNPEPVINTKGTNSSSLVLSPEPLTSASAKDTISIVAEPISIPVPEIKNTEPGKEELPKTKKIITVIKRDTVRIKDTVNLKRFHW